MKVEELIRLLGRYPPSAVVTVSEAPGRRVTIAGHTAFLEHDAGELCEPCEVTLLSGDIWEGTDLDGQTA